MSVRGMYVFDQEPSWLGAVVAIMIPQAVRVWRRTIPDGVLAVA